MGALAAFSESRHDTLVPSAATLSGPVGTRILPLWAAVPLIAESLTSPQTGEHFFFNAAAFPVLASFLADQNGRFPGHAESGGFARLAAKARRGQASLIGIYYAEHLFRQNRLGGLLCHGHAANLADLPGVRFRPLVPQKDGIPTALASVSSGAIVAGTDRPLEAEAFLTWLVEPETAIAAAARGLAPLDRTLQSRLADDPRTRHLPDALARAVLLDDPDGYRLRRLAFPAWRVFALLFIEPDPVAAFTVHLRDALERKPGFADQ
jgi:hypothetical protein